MPIPDSIEMTFLTMTDIISGANPCTRTIQSYPATSLPFRTIGTSVFNNGLIKRSDDITVM